MPATAHQWITLGPASISLVYDDTLASPTLVSVIVTAPGPVWGSIVDTVSGKGISGVVQPGTFPAPNGISMAKLASFVAPPLSNDPGRGSRISVSARYPV